MLKNIIANFVGRFWSILSNYLFIPVYISMLGLESYSVISFSLVVLGVVSIMDSGLTSTLSKEFASKQNSNEDKFKLLASLEACYMLITALIILFFALFSDYIAAHWLHLNNLNSETVAFYLRILSVGVAFQMISNFYLGGLIGLERQVMANFYQIAWGVFRNGVVILLLYFQPSLTVFFLWQTLITVIYVIILRYNLQSSVNNRPTFTFSIKIDKKVLKKVSKFAGGMFLISIVASINTQLDKLVISKLLRIEELGFYNIAGSMAQAILVIVSPFSIALLPRFTVLFSENKTNEVKELYNRILLMVSLIVFSVCANINFNSEQLFWAWTGDRGISQHIIGYVPYVTIGTAFLAILSIPFCIAIANGYTKLNNIIGILSLFITIPGYWIMVGKFGPKGAAICWLCVHLLITPVYFHFINKKFLNSASTITLLFKKIILPMFLTFVIAYVFTFADFNNLGRILIIGRIGVVTILTFLISLFILLSKADLRMQTQFFTNLLSNKKGQL